MLAPVVFFSLALLVVGAVRLRRWWKHRDDPPMIVTTWPEIEMRQPYGGWDADAYDAFTGRDRRVNATRTYTAGRSLASRPPRRYG